MFLQANVLRLILHRYVKNFCKQECFTLKTFAKYIEAFSTISHGVMM